jgi:membrane protein required for beta-lactamase induction
MFMITIIIAALLEYKRFTKNIHNIYDRLQTSYVEFFINSPSKSGSLLKIYLYACIPITVTLLLIHILLENYLIAKFVVELLLLIVSVRFLSWKNHDISSHNHHLLTNRYAVSFFGALFWFTVIPGAIGAIDYIVIAALSQELKNKSFDSVAYNNAIDKILFYINIIPYSIIFLYVAIVANFEDIMHYLIGQYPRFCKSYYFLENILNELISQSISNDKKQSDDLNVSYIDPKVRNYIVAILYRVGIFFVATISIISVAHQLS